MLTNVPEIVRQKRFYKAFFKQTVCFPQCPTHCHHYNTDVILSGCDLGGKGQD